MNNEQKNGRFMFDESDLTDEEANEILPFVCPFCGNKYSDPDTYLNCAAKCRKGQKEELEKEQTKKLQAEKLARNTEINELTEILYGKIEAYSRDYAEAKAPMDVQRQRIQVLPEALELLRILDVL